MKVSNDINVMEVLNETKKVNDLLKKVSIDVDSIAFIVNKLVKKGVPARVIAYYSGCISPTDVRNFVRIANNELSSQLWLASPPGLLALRKAKVHVQNQIVEEGARIWNAETKKSEVFPVNKITRRLAIQLIDKNGKIRTVEQQCRFLKKYEEEVKTRPLFRIEDNKVIFSRGGSVSISELKKAINKK